MTINAEKINAQAVPDGATDMIDDGFKTDYYKRVRAFNLSVLQVWDNEKSSWIGCGTLPWGELKPVSKNKEFIVSVEDVAIDGIQANGEDGMEPSDSPACAHSPGM